MDSVLFFVLQGRCETMKTGNSKNINDKMASNRTA